MRKSGRWMLVPLGLALSSVTFSSNTAAAGTPVALTCTQYDQATWWAWGVPHDIVHGVAPMMELSGYVYDYTLTVNSGTYHTDPLYGTIAAEHNVVNPASCS